MPQPLGLGHMVRIRINVEAIKYNVLPGLSITPEWKGEEKGFDRSSYVLTHHESGKKLGEPFPTRAALDRCLDFYSVIDWTRDKEELLADSETHTLGAMANGIAKHADFRVRGNREKFEEAANAFYEHIGDAMIILSKLEAAI